MANIDRLVGSDASLMSMSFGPALVTGTATSGVWYQIATVSGTAVFPAGYVVGDLVLGNGQAFSASNSAKLATETVVADCNSFDFQFSADEIEVTTLVDGIKKYRKGKVDLSGTINGINTISEMRKAGSIVNRFIRVVTATSVNVATLNTLAESAFYIKAYLQDSTTSGESLVFLFGQVELYGYSAGAAIGDAQSYSSGVRFIGADPMLVIKDNA